MISVLNSGMSSLLDYCLLYAMNTKPTEVKEYGEFIWLDFSIRFISVCQGDVFEGVQGRDFVISLHLPDRSCTYVSVPYEFELTQYHLYLVREIYKKAVSFVERGCASWV